MVKVAVIADIHGNLPALAAVMKSIIKQKVDYLFCLGDLVGYGPWPNECIQVVKRFNKDVELADICVMGNHDYYIVQQEIADWFNDQAQASTKFTLEVITPENLALLESLPTLLEYEIAGVSVYISHGSPLNPIRGYVYDKSPAMSEAWMFQQEHDIQILLMGHTHFPFLSRLFDTKPRMMINPGSVGQPRDGNPNASYAVIDIQDQFFINVQHHRVAYDIDVVAKGILEAGLPKSLADRLYEGT